MKSYVVTLDIVQKIKLNHFLKVVTMVYGLSPQTFEVWAPEMCESSMPLIINGIITPIDLL